jgi:prolyl-tRNA editing enzyme YbaK/EbsC (Cys-tRNA(Pro) deacylase)
LKDTAKKLTRDGAPYYLAVTSAADRFSLKAFKQVTNCKHLRFATPEECFTQTGSLTGAVSPFGKIYEMPVWVDRGLSKQERISFMCGLRRVSSSISYRDYFHIEQPVLQVFTKEEISLGDLPEIVPLAIEKKLSTDPNQAKKTVKFTAEEDQKIEATK